MVCSGIQVGCSRCEVRPAQVQIKSCRDKTDIFCVRLVNEDLVRQIAEKRIECLRIERDIRIVIAFDPLPESGEPEANILIGLPEQADQSSLLIVIVNSMFAIYHIVDKACPIISSQG